MSPRYVSTWFFSFTSWGNEGYCGRQFQGGTDHQGEALNVCCHRQIAYVSYHWFEMVWTLSDSTTFLWALACPDRGETYCEQGRESRAGPLQNARAPFEECRNLTGCHARKFSHWLRRVIFSMHKQSLVTSIFPFYSFCISSCSRFGTWFF